MEPGHPRLDAMNEKPQAPHLGDESTRVDAREAGDGALRLNS